jgi:hypothetical protein
MASQRSAGYEFSPVSRFSRGDKSEGPWVRVEGGDLPIPIEIRVHRGSDGRTVVTGLVAGTDGGLGEITAAMLRRIPLGEIVTALFDEEFPGGDLADVVRYIRPAVVRGVMQARTDAAPAVGTRSRRPQEAEYREFAETYLKELARSPHRAMTNAARAHRLSRATANRWADACRQLGYLPPKGTNQ